MGSTDIKWPEIWRRQPPLLKKHFLKLPGFIVNTARRNYRMIAAAIRAVQSGQRPENIVNGL